MAVRSPVRKAAGGTAQALGVVAVASGVIMAVGVAIVLPIGFSGVVLSILWRWFITGTFGVPSISVWEAIGITAIVSLLVTSPSATKEEDIGTVFWRSMLAPAVCLAIGWIALQFIH